MKKDPVAGEQSGPKKKRKVVQLCVENNASNVICRLGLSHSAFNKVMKQKKILNNHAPSNKKYIRGNHLPFMNKEL